MNPQRDLQLAELYRREREQDAQNQRLINSLPRLATRTLRQRLHDWTNVLTSLSAKPAAPVHHLQTQE